MNLKDITVNRNIADGDGMAKGRQDVYFKTGRNALNAIIQTLNSAHVQPSEVGRVLDYACGYGRVLRWLDAAFPKACLLGVDVDQKAVNSAAENLGVNTRILDPTLNDRLDDPFDLIWVGSLFTHLPRSEAGRVLNYLKSHLTAQGVLVFTVHGHFVAKRLRQREKTYNLAEQKIVQILEEFDSGAFAFAPYDHAENYGISLSSPGNVVELLEQADLAPVYFRARGWVNHQDVFGCQVLQQ